MGPHCSLKLIVKHIFTSLVLSIIVGVAYVLQRAPQQVVFQELRGIVRFDKSWLIVLASVRQHLLGCLNAFPTDGLWSLPQVSCLKGTILALCLQLWLALARCSWVLSRLWNRPVMLGKLKFPIHNQLDTKIKYLAWLSLLLVFTIIDLQNEPRLNLICFAAVLVAPEQLPSYYGTKRIRGRLKHIRRLYALGTSTVNFSFFESIL